MGTKLYFHINSWRKNYIVLTFNIITFSRGCKPRITSYLIVGSIWPVTMPQRAYPRDLQFCLCLVVYSPPPGMQKETIPHSRAPDQHYICVLGVHLFKSKIDFHQFFKIDVLSLILIKLALSYFLLQVCALNNPAAISMSKILGNNCYWNMWHPLYIICNWWPVVMWWVFMVFYLAVDNLRSDYYVQPFCGF